MLTVNSVVIDSSISVSPVSHPPKSSSDWSEKKLDTISADVQYTTTAYKNQQAAKSTASSINRTTDASVIPPYGSSLHSDKIVTHGFVKTPDKPLVSL